MGRYPYGAPTESSRTLDRIRDGAQHGISQVFTAAEILRLLDRIEKLERIERAAHALADRYERNWLGRLGVIGDQMFETLRDALETTTKET